MSDEAGQPPDRGTRRAALFVVEVSAPAARDLREQPIPEAVLAAFLRLIAEGGQLETRPLTGKPMRDELAGTRRWKLGDQAHPWRVIYEVDEEQWSVTVLSIRPRPAAYHRR